MEDAVKTEAQETKDATLAQTVIAKAKMMALTCNAAVCGYNEKYVSKAVQTGKKLAKDVDKNAREAFEGLTEDAKKLLKKIPVLESVMPVTVENDDYYVVQTYAKAKVLVAATVKTLGQKVEALRQ